MTDTLNKMTDEIVDAVKNMQLSDTDKGTLYNLLEMPSEDPMVILGALLSLSDEAFEVISPLFREVIIDAFNSPEAITAIQAAMVNGEGSMLELEQAFNDVSQQIDELPEDQMSNLKKTFLHELINAVAISFRNANDKTREKVIVLVQLDEGAEMPYYAHEDDAGMDIKCIEDFTLAPGETKVVKTGVHMAVPQGYHIEVRCRSGIAAKTCLTLKNGVGTIDYGYTGEIGLILTNLEPHIKDFQIDEEGHIIPGSILYGKTESFERGTRMAQLLLVKTPKALLERVEKLPDTERGTGGYGSTGIH